MTRRNRWPGTPTAASTARTQLRRREQSQEGRSRGEQLALFGEA